MTDTTPDLAAVEAAAALLAARDDFRVLRKLEPHDDFGGSAAGGVGSAIVLDTETTGTDLQSDQVIELAMLRVEYALDSGKVVRVVDSFEGLEDPGRPIPPESTKIHGITDAMVAGAPPIGRLVPQLVELTRGSVLVAHNAAFDRRFLPFLAHRPSVCSYRLAARVVPEAPNHKNQTLGRFFDVRDPELNGRRAHRALADVIVTRHVFFHCIDRYVNAGYTDDLDELIAFVAPRQRQRSA